MSTDLCKYLRHVEGGDWRPFLHFTVAGVAQPKGNARAYTYDRAEEKGGGVGARVDMDGKKTKVWERLVKNEAWAAFLALPFVQRAKRLGPVAVELHFWLPQPRKVPAVRENEPALKPDLDKLARCALDALTGLVWLDDGQVVLLLGRKHYAPTLQVCRLEYTVAEKVDDAGALPLEP